MKSGNIDKISIKGSFQQAEEPGIYFYGGITWEESAANAENKVLWIGRDPIQSRYSNINNSCFI